MLVNSDGTLSASIRGSSTRTVRLIGVDLHGVGATDQPDQYGQITDIVCLDQWGLRALELVRHSLNGQEVVLVSETVTPTWDALGRQVAYIDFYGEDFNAVLIEKGYAWVDTDGGYGRLEDYVTLGEQAKASRLGLWQCLE